MSIVERMGLKSVSDRYGRKKVLLATMTGNLLSAVVWLRSTTFVSAETRTELRIGYIPALPIDWWAQ